MPLDKEKAQALKAQLKLAKKKPLPFFYCPEGEDGEPVLLIGKRIAAEAKAAKKTAKKRKFVQGEVVSGEEGLEFRADKPANGFEKKLKTYFGKDVPALKKAQVSSLKAAADDAGEAPAGDAPPAPPPPPRAARAPAPPPPRKQLQVFYFVKAELVACNARGEVILSNETTLYQGGGNPRPVAKSLPVPRGTTAFTLNLSAEATGPGGGTSAAVCSGEYAVSGGKTRLKSSTPVASNSGEWASIYDVKLTDVKFKNDQVAFSSVLHRDEGAYNRENNASSTESDKVGISTPDMGGVLPSLSGEHERSSTRGSSAGSSQTVGARDSVIPVALSFALNSEPVIVAISPDEIAAARERGEIPPEKPKKPKPRAR